MLKFGTAGLRGPLGDGPDAMNVATVTAATAGVAAWLRERCLGGGLVVVGRDARHGSAEFAAAAAEVFAGAGFPVLLFDRPIPTPVLAFTVRARDAVAGVQITASHNPPGDNGYKVYLAGGAQLIPPADAEIERHIAAVGDFAAVARTPVDPAPDSDELVRRYLDRVTGLAQSPLDERAALPAGRPPGHAAWREAAGDSPGVRVALTALHGVGGELARAALAGAGFPDVHVVAEQFEPDPDFPTVQFPNPEEPGATDLLLELAEGVAADIAIALDPDADRCAVGVPTPDGWRMLSGDELGALLGDYVMATAAADPADSVVAATVVSSRLLSKLAPARGVRYAETLTGFKWLARAADGTGGRLVYAYEEAIGYCCDPDAVRDKDGISAAVLAAHMVARLGGQGRTLLDVLDGYAVECGLHVTDQLAIRVDDLAEIQAMMARLRAAPPRELAGAPIEVDDLAGRRGPMRTDAVVLRGDATRVVIRPSGTEPKLKAYLEIATPVSDPEELAPRRTAATAALHTLRAEVRSLLGA